MSSLEKYPSQSSLDLTMARPNMDSTLGWGELFHFWRMFTVKRRLCLIPGDVICTHPSPPSPEGADAKRPPRPHLVCAAVCACSEIGKERSKSPALLCISRLKGCIKDGFYMLNEISIPMLKKNPFSSDHLHLLSFIPPNCPHNS